MHPLHIVSAHSNKSQQDSMLTISRKSDQTVWSKSEGFLSLLWLKVNNRRDVAVNTLDISPVGLRFICRDWHSIVLLSCEAFEKK